MNGFGAILFSAAIFLSAGALWVRRQKRGLHRKRQQAAPGRSANNPIVVQRFDAMDHVVARSRCHCGDTLGIRSEGSLQASGGAVRVVHTECRGCEDNHDFFFDMSKILH